MFLDIQIAMSMCVVYDFMYREKSLFTDVYVFKNVGFLVLVNFEALLFAQFLFFFDISYTKMFVLLLLDWHPVCR